MNFRSNNACVYIAGVGAYTAVGLNGQSTAAAVRAGLAGFSEHPFMLNQQGDPMIVARAPYVKDDAKGIDRLMRLAIPAIREALAPLEHRRVELSSVPMILGLPPERPGRPAGMESELGQQLRTELRVISMVKIIQCGHSAGLMALETGWRNILSGSNEFCLVGAVDSYLEPQTLAWLQENGQLHGGENPWGFVPGEAAGFCLLCSKEAVEQFGIPVLARIRTAATAYEVNLIKTDTICVGRGLTEAVNQALQSLPSVEEKIDYVICDMNGETYRADEYGFTIARTSTRFVDAANFMAPADCWGDVGAASAPLFVNLIVSAVLRGYLTMRNILIWTSSESGERSAAIIHPEICAGIA